MSIPTCIYLGRDRMAARMNWGGWVVAPTFNVDVAIGALRDGVIEAWTTRLVQELLRPGDCYFNAGANFGYYVALGGGIVGQHGKVYAVEPNPHILPHLMLTIFWSGISERTRVFRRALSHTSGAPRSFLFDPQFLGGGSALEVWSRGGRHEAQQVGFESAVWSPEALEALTDKHGEIAVARGRFVPFHAVTATIDEICKDAAALSLIHLDIEGSEPLALAGAKATIARSPRCKLITEWSSAHYTQGSAIARQAFDEFWAFAEEEGYRVRQLEPRLAPDGSIFVSPLRDRAYMTERAVHGDYVWVRAADDPWG